MFDLIAGTAVHTPRRPAVPIVISVLTQVALVAAVVITTVLGATDRLPQIPTMMAFVAAPPPPPPPPPPPAAPAPARPTPTPTPQVTRAAAAPIEAPASVDAAPAIDEVTDVLPGGLAGGLPGGVIGGVAGGLVTDLPAVRPVAQVPSLPSAPVRVGGQIEPPALLHRVEPEYPPVAVAANLQGMVILEAIVDQTGRVSEVKVIRSAGTLLDRSAMAAVGQWRYSPLVLNGRHERFVLTVMLSFSLQTAQR